MRADLKREGPVLKVKIGMARAEARARRQQGQAVPRAQSLRALVDTGASCTGLRPALAEALGLERVSLSRVSSVYGRNIPIWVYRARITGPAGPKPFTWEGNVYGLDLPCTPPVVLGRDLLEGLVLCYHGPGGIFTLSLAEPEEEPNTEPRDLP